jgi:hypothetical protein
MFNAQTGQIEGVVTDTIQQEQSDIDQFRGRVGGYIARLRGTEQGGRLRIVGNVPGAEVLVDGERAGITDAEGVFATDVGSGARRVEVRAEGYASFRGSITVAPGTESELEVNLVEGSGFDGEVSAGGGVNWAGVGLLGLGAVAAGWTIYVWFTVMSDDNSEVFQEYRGMVPSAGTEGATPENGNGDACESARLGNNWMWAPNDERLDEVKSICSREDNFLYGIPFQILTSVVAVGSIGLGVFLLTSGDAEEEPPALTVVPTIRPNSFDLSATLRF